MARHPDLESTRQSVVSTVLELIESADRAVLWNRRRRRWSPVASAVADGATPPSASTWPSACAAALDRLPVEDEAQVAYVAVVPALGEAFADPPAADGALPPSLGALLIGLPRLEHSRYALLVAPAGLEPSTTAKAMITDFAALAAVNLDYAEQRGGLSSALDARHRIGLAQGVLMARYGLTPETAFAVMSRTSQDTNIKLRLIADHVVQTGDLNVPGLTIEAADAVAGT